MREALCQLHTRAANRPVRTTKLLVRETLALNIGTTRVQHGISVGNLSSANRRSRLLFQLYYLRQNAGVKRTSTLKISRRPTSMAAVQIQV